MPMLTRFSATSGYSYRLCPASEPLTEVRVEPSCLVCFMHCVVLIHHTPPQACFQAHPLDFLQEKHALVFQNGSRLPIKGVFTDVGTSPRNSTWARLPIPSGWAEWMPPTTRGLGPRCVCDESGDGTPGDYSCGNIRNRRHHPRANTRRVILIIARLIRVFIVWAGCKRGEEEDGCLAPGNCSTGLCEPCPGTVGSDCSRCDNRINVTAFAPPAPAAAMKELPAILDVVKVPRDLLPGAHCSTNCARKRRNDCPQRPWSRFHDR
jgi:hypothetical protein